MPLCPAPITTPSYSIIFGIFFRVIERLELFERLEHFVVQIVPAVQIVSKPSTSNLKLQVFFHHLPTIATRSGNDGVRRMRGDPDLVQPLYGRAITRELFHRPISSHLSGDLACYPNRTAPHMEPAAGDIKWIHCDFHFDVIVRVVGGIALPDRQN